MSGPLFQFCSIWVPAISGRIPLKYFVWCLDETHFSSGNALRLKRSYPMESILLPDDKVTHLNIKGQYAQNSEILLFSDFYNQRVKYLQLRTGTISVIFEEKDEGWKVSNSMPLVWGHDHFLAVSEINQFAGPASRTCQRLVIAKDDQSGAFRTDYIVPLEEHPDVCAYSARNYRPQTNPKIFLYVPQVY